MAPLLMQGISSSLGMTKAGGHLPSSRVATSVKNFDERTGDTIAVDERTNWEVHSNITHSKTGLGKRAE